MNDQNATKAGKLNRNDERSAETRARLIDTAIELFGLLGFDGTSTRMLTSTAGTALSAIRYHFGTKKDLYLAATTSIAERISQTLGPAITAFEGEIYSDDLTRERAIALLEEIFTPFVMMLSSEESEKWARFTLREQAAPTDAFDILLKSDIGRFFKAVVHLTAMATNDDPDSPAARVRAITLLGQALAFRAARALSLRLLSRDRLLPSDLVLITATIRENIRLLRYL